ncbi:MAG: phage virion morphogenesis protein [Deltaproteobacteria bacterium]|nr:phage virion morphogenesis protein [Deltaproteobacteria bacterium]
MAGVEITVEIEDEPVKKLLAEIQNRVRNLEPAMGLIGEIVQSSILENFEKQGRPTRWAHLSPATIEQRKKKGKWPGKILQRTGALKRIAYTASATKVELTANAPYAAVQQFGARKGEFGTVAARVKAHVRKIGDKTVTVSGHIRTVPVPWGDIPARPFMMVQDEDWDEIIESLKDYILALEAT